jgi:hypothetical protein
MKTDVKSEMHNLGYRPPLHISTVTSHCFADSILGKVFETMLRQHTREGLVKGTLM